jgi:menaquinone reductase, multiheme cytochrome c subunit
MNQPASRASMRTAGFAWQEAAPASVRPTLTRGPEWIGSAGLREKRHKDMGRYHYVFPEWTNLALPSALILGPLVTLYVIYVVAYGFSPNTLWVGYEPEQPIPFSHKVHAGQLGMDCRYCHTTVEHAAFASVPPTQTCMSCHTQILPESRNLRPLWRSYESGRPIEWIKVHDLPDYAYFDHAAHVNAGVSCVECHGRVDRMEVLYQEKPLSMGWCLDCHNQPEPHLRPVDQVTNMAWQPTEDQYELAQMIISKRNIVPPIYCNACHR